MSRSLSAAAVVIFLLIGFLATLTSGAPTNLARGEPDIARRHGHVNSTSSTDSTNSTTSTDSTDTTNSTNTTDSTDSTNSTVTDDSVNNANALSTTTNGEVRQFSDPRRSIVSLQHPCAQATWYTPGLGACGQTNTESDFIVALNAGDWAGGSHCGQVRSAPFSDGFGSIPDLFTLSLT